MKALNVIFDWTFGSALVGLFILLLTSMSIALVRWLRESPERSLLGVQVVVVCFVIGLVARLIWHVIH